MIKTILVNNSGHMDCFAEIVTHMEDTDCVI